MASPRPVEALELYVFSGALFIFLCSFSVWCYISMYGWNLMKCINFKKKELSTTVNVLGEWVC